MNNASIVWSEAKQQRLFEEITGYWQADTCEIAQCPDFEHGTAVKRTLRFTCISPALNAEIKYACSQKIKNKEWSRTSILDLSFRIHRLIKWLNGLKPMPRSLIEHSLQSLEMSFRSYLAEAGKFHLTTVTWLDRSQRLRHFSYDSQYITVLRQLYALIEDYYDDRPVYEKDIWDLKKLNVPSNASMPIWALKFKNISQPWLRQSAKKFMKHSLSTRYANTCRHILSAIDRFSAFAGQYDGSLQAAGLTRSLMVDYVGYLSATGLSAQTRANFLVNLRTFIETCSQLAIAGFPIERIIYDEDLPKIPKSLPRFIPQDVLDQLFRHLDQWDLQWQRMILVLYECGLRVGELLTLPLDCLYQDSEGDWFLHYYQWKLKQAHTQPVSREVAAVVQTQQEEVRKKWGDKVEILFPNAKGTPIVQTYFRQVINAFAYQNNICDASGRLWRFQPHQFRHSFATRLINNGVPQHIVQRLMGHRSPEMTNRYAHIHDATLKEEYAKALSGRKLVDISGQVIAGGVPEETADLQWLKKHVDTRTLSNGWCGIPIALGPCPHPNACLTCPHFRTDRTHLATHEKQLSETVKMIQISQERGWTVQADNNEQVATNLRNIITALKESTDDTSAKC
jgi:integrase